MRDGLDAGARGVDVGAEVGGEDGEGGGGETFGAEVDVFAVERGGGDEEDGLGHGPGLEVGFDLGVEFDHGWRCGWVVGRRWEICKSSS